MKDLLRHQNLKLYLYRSSRRLKQNLWRTLALPCDFLRVLGRRLKDMWEWIVMSWISRFRNSISRRLSNDDVDKVHERKKKAQTLLEQARDQLAQVESIRKSQQQVSESLRKQVAQNHFADLIQYGIPVVMDEEEKKS